MDSVGSRVKHARAMRGLTQKELAEKASTKRQPVVQQTVQQIEANRPKNSRMLPAIAAALDVRLEWLTEKIGPMEGMPSIGTPVPLVSFVQAGDWTESPIVAAAAEEWISCDSRVSERAFALRLKGLSMLPRFNDGDVIIIDPAIEPIPGDFVVAKIRAQEEATFKQYRRKSPKEYELRALNPDYETLTVTSKTGGMIIGPVVEHHSYRKTL